MPAQSSIFSLGAPAARSNVPAPSALFGAAAARPNVPAPSALFGAPAARQDIPAEGSIIGAPAALDGLSKSTSILPMSNLFRSSRPRPLFRAVATSTRPLYQLLKTISFANKVHVEITEDGLRFSVDHARVMQGVVHWNKSLFTTYRTNLPAAEAEEGAAEEGGETTAPVFQISIPALLETLQIFGAVDAVARQADAQLDPYRSRLKDYKPDAFSNQILGLSGTCSLSYSQEGGPLSIVMDEIGVKTTCKLTTYVAEIPDDIPFDLDELSFKIIMPARVLLDVLGEIASSQPEKLTITALRKRPYLRLSSTGGLGSTAVDFGRGRDLFETLSVAHRRWKQSFKFEIIKSATEAMKIATKVSLRGDKQGVLSMQFMVEVEGSGQSFLDFRFVPYAEEEYEDDGTEGEQDEGEGEEL